MGKNQENLDNSQLPPICGLNIDIYQSIPKIALYQNMSPFRMTLSLNI